MCRAMTLVSSIFWATQRIRISLKYDVYLKQICIGRENRVSTKRYILASRHPSSASTTSRENTRICCEAEVDKRTARNAYATESATSESEGMNRSCDKTVSRARFLSWDQERVSRSVFPFARDSPGFSPESRQPFKLDHYLMNSQHTTIAVFARRSLIICLKDITSRKIKILTT